MNLPLTAARVLSIIGRIFRFTVTTTMRTDYRARIEIRQRRAAPDRSESQLGRITFANDIFFT